MEGLNPTQGEVLGEGPEDALCAPSPPGHHL